MPLLKFGFNYQGFSLMELLLSIALIGIITTIALPNLRNFSANQEIDGAASELASILKNAQSSASAHIKCPNGETSSSWQVNLNTATTTDTYNLVANCLPSGVPRTIYSSPFAITPKSQTTFNAVTDRCTNTNENATIYFTDLMVTYKCASAVSPSVGTIRITLSKAGVLDKTVVVEAGGVIRIE